MGPTWGPPGSCRPQMGPMLAPWTLLSVYIFIYMLWQNQLWNVYWINFSQEKSVNSLTRCSFWNQYQQRHVIQKGWFRTISSIEYQTERVVWIEKNVWGLWCQKQVSQAGISNYIPQFTVGCSYLSLSEIPASGNKVLIYVYIYEQIIIW